MATTTATWARLEAMVEYIASNFATFSEIDRQLILIAPSIFAGRCRTATRDRQFRQRQFHPPDHRGGGDGRCARRIFRPRFLPPWSSAP